MSPESYRLVLLRTARKELLTLPTKIGDQVERTIDRLLATFQEGKGPQDVRPLEGRPHCHRIDSGEYRILFDVDEVDRLITVFRIRHRKDVYRNL
ncbi:MAG: type II toxin-antitoxin system RelE family toxin [Chloroflexota bacterium]